MRQQMDDSKINNSKINNSKINKAVFCSFLALAWPTVIEQLLGTILQYVDTAMVGWLGASATATVSLSSTYTWLINSIMSAAGIGFLAFIARAIGEKNQEKVQKAAGQAMLTAGTIGLVLTVIVMICAPFMPGWMGADVSIRKAAGWYFAIINMPLVLRSAMVIFGAVIRSTGDTKTPMKINVLVNLLNVGLNWIFIYGLSLGAIGAGIATAISYAIGGVLMTCAFLKNKQLDFRWCMVKPDREILGACMQIAFPVMLTQIASCSGYIVATSFVSSMTTTIYAAHSIAITAEQLFYIPGYGMQAATSTLIGNALGEKNREKEMAVVRASIITIFLLMCVTGTLLFVGAEFMMSLFTKDTEVIAIGTGLLRIVAFTEPIFGTCAVMDGIYHGLGRTRFPFAVETFTRWVVRIGGSWIVIHLFSGGIREVWYAMITDNITKATLLAIGLILLFRKKESD